MTKFKKIAAAIAVAASIGSIGLVSYADTPQNQTTPNNDYTLMWGAGNARNDFTVQKDKLLAFINHGIVY